MSKGALDYKFSFSHLNYLISVDQSLYKCKAHRNVMGLRSINGSIIIIIIVTIIIIIIIHGNASSIEPKFSTCNSYQPCSQLYELPPVVFKIQSKSGL